MSWAGWWRRLVRGLGVASGRARVQRWPADRPRPTGPPRFAPLGAERLRDPLEVADERERVLDWRVRELERDRALERERYRRERRP
jgi:hypothetical protein